MKSLFLTLILAGLSAVACAGPVKKVSDFELTDQNERIRVYAFPKEKITVMTVADHKGSGQLAPWIRQLYDRYEKQIDIDGVADVSMIAKPFHGLFRAAFRRQLAYSVMLDWDGDVVKQFGYEKGVANIFVIDRMGYIVRRITGSASDGARQKLFIEIDRAIAGQPNSSP